MQNDVFNKEKERQASLTPRTEKIEVQLVGKTDAGTTFVMNKNVSTPYSCAMRKWRVVGAPLLLFVQEEGMLIALRRSRGRSSLSGALLSAPCGSGSRGVLWVSTGRSYHAQVVLRFV